MARTIASSFTQRHIDKIAAAVVRLLRANTSLEDWTEGRIYRATGAVNKDTFAMLPAIFVNVTSVNPTHMPNTRERNRVIIGIVVIWEEFDIYLEDIDEATISTVLQEIKVQILSDVYLKDSSLTNERLVERVNEILVTDIEGETPDDSEKNVMLTSVQVDYTLDAKTSDQTKLP